LARLLIAGLTERGEILVNQTIASCWQRMPCSQERTGQCTCRS
jgi:hypothetical protein